MRPAVMLFGALAFAGAASAQQIPTGRSESSCPRHPDRPPISPRGWSRRSSRRRSDSRSSRTISPAPAADRRRSRGQGRARRVLVACRVERTDLDHAGAAEDAVRAAEGSGAGSLIARFRSRSSPILFPAANAKEFVAVSGRIRTSTPSPRPAPARLRTCSPSCSTRWRGSGAARALQGTVPALTDVMNGQITYAVETVAATGSHIKAGRLKAFGSRRRGAGGAADVPPLAEAADLPDYDAAAWIGYAAPPGTPREVLARLAAEIQKALAADELKERFVSSASTRRRARRTRWRRSCAASRTATR